MSTSSMIGIYNKADGSVTCSYCHSDGYVNGVGRTLNESYNSQYDAEIVTNGGYLSSLNDDYMISRQSSVHQDSAVTYSCVSEYLNEAVYHAGAAYLYLFDGEAWFFTDTSIKSGFEEVEMNLKSAA
jgi:hypothetical protein